MAVKFELPFTQTSTIVAFICTLLVAVAVSPIGRLEVGKEELTTTLVRLTHLSTFGTWLGVQVWVTFFAGVTMFKYLPRHMFGFIQSKLFPKYFTLGTVLSSVCIITYLIEHPFPQWERVEKIQGYSLGISLAMVLFNLLYFEPQTSKCSFDKHKFEKEVSAGQAVGKVEEEKLAELRKNPQYVALEKKFVRLHTFASIANLVALAAQAIHLWYVTCQLKSI